MQMNTPRARIVAALGPTNTGKTYLAFERMLGHGSGMIGFPLRLLARENYERAVALKGARQVALITGEEKILPPYAKYFFCTVESMPIDLEVDFLAVDEIQLCADADRGHIFTDRLLNARGRQETMFMGADAFRPLLTRLVPETEIITRPRFSSLSFAGVRKIARLPARSAVVGFSANDIYAIAELIRRQRGGAAIVMGALSPRTRNAQVAMFQNGDVDYLVATDAIGMGLNMDVDHVAFAALKKFDGNLRRDLRADELGQIAGRAGRHMNNGTFGVTGDVTGLDPEMIQAIENHRYDPVRQIFWRTPTLDYSDLKNLSESLKKTPDLAGLARVREPDDERVLRELTREEEVTARVHTPAHVRLLWEVCQVPDYRKTIGGDHARLLGRIFKHLSDGQLLPADWIADQVARLHRTDGGIDTLVSRIAGIRIWTYIAHRPGWLMDAADWQARTREVEDALSDALHDSLTQRFVDQRTASLVRRLRDKEDLTAAVSTDGDVLVEGHFVGTLDGFRFLADRADGEVAGKAVTNAAFRALGREVERRVQALIADEDTAFDLTDQARLVWRGAGIARLIKGGSALTPRIRLTASELLEQPQRQTVENRLARWLEGEIKTRLAPLLKLRDASLTGAARGLAFQVVDGFGVLPRKTAGQQLKALEKGDYGVLRHLGVKLGRREIFMPALMKPKPAVLAAKLWAVFNELEKVPDLPPPGRVSLPVGEAGDLQFLRVAGYRRAGPLVVRVDILERLMGQFRKRAANGAFTPDPDLLNLAGCTLEQMAGVLESLGYRRAGDEEDVCFEPATQLPKKRKFSRRQKSTDRMGPAEVSPFAKLKELSLGT